MIKIENSQVVGLEPAIRGIRNPMNSWKKSDSDYRVVLSKKCDECGRYMLPEDDSCDGCEISEIHLDGYTIGPNDHDLMMSLAKQGAVHGKFRRMIVVYVDITAPLYWWKQFDTYQVGTVKNSCSTMHKIHAKEFTLEDFSHEHLIMEEPIPGRVYSPLGMMATTVENLNIIRELFLETRDKKWWWQMIALLPSCYNQKRTVMLNYEVLANIYQYRREHKLDEWRGLCKWIEGLPYSGIITCNAGGRRP